MVTLMTCMGMKLCTGENVGWAIMNYWWRRHELYNNGLGKSSLSHHATHSRLTSMEEYIRIICRYLMKLLKFTWVVYHILSLSFAKTNNVINGSSDFAQFEYYTFTYYLWVDPLIAHLVKPTQLFLTWHSSCKNEGFSLCTRLEVFVNDCPIVGRISS